MPPTLTDYGLIGSTAPFVLLVLSLGNLFAAAQLAAPLIEVIDGAATGLARLVQKTLSLAFYSYTALSMLLLVRIVARAYFVARPRDGINISFVVFDLLILGLVCIQAFNASLLVKLRVREERSKVARNRAASQGD